MFEKFTWTITNFSLLDSKIYWKKFSLDCHTWCFLHSIIIHFSVSDDFSFVFLIQFSNSVFRKILIFPKGDEGNYLSIYLEYPGAALMPQGWQKFANFKFILVNQLDHTKNIINGIYFTLLSLYSLPSFSKVI